MENLLIPVVISVLVSIIFSVIFKDKSKVDKGFKINYYRLSYRRKMIRTLTSSPILVLAIAVIFLYTDLSMLSKVWIGLFFLLLYLIQFIYNFYMWKKKEG
ncbi:hypothetical protein M3231_00840 [Neobacillus mesonae]|nr:hypothetical protein [Neobacillus mesonae]